MTVFLVKTKKYLIPDGTTVFKYYSSSTWNSFTLSSDFLGDIEELLKKFYTVTSFAVSGLFDSEKMTSDVALDFSANEVSLEIGKDIGFSLDAEDTSNTTALYWGISRLLFDGGEEAICGNYAEDTVPFEYESGFTIDGRSFKENPGVITYFYSVELGPYTHKQVKEGVLPFISNLESDMDLFMSIDGYNEFSGYFSSRVFQISPDGDFLKPSELHNGKLLGFTMSERPSDVSDGQIVYFVVDSSGNFLTKSDGSFATIKR